MTSNGADSGHLPLMTTRTRYRAAQRRLCTAHASRVGRPRTVRCFERSLVDLGRLGLSGTGLIVAAEHMAASRLRAYKSTPGDSQ
jgi:hypothetical protein